MTDVLCRIQQHITGHTLAPNHGTMMGKNQRCLFLEVCLSQVLLCIKKIIYYPVRRLSLLSTSIISLHYPCPSSLFIIHVYCLSSLPISIVSLYCPCLCLYSLSLSIVSSFCPCLLFLFLILVSLCCPCYLSLFIILLHSILILCVCYFCLLFMSSTYIY